MGQLRPASLRAKPLRFPLKSEKTSHTPRQAATRKQTALQTAKVASQLGKACSSFQKCHFRQFFSLKFLLESAIFRHFSPTTKRHFSPHFAPRKSAIFRENSRKTGSTQLTPRNWTIFRGISHREKYNFSTFSLREKSAIFRRISLREKKVPFSRKKSRKTGSTQQAGKAASNYLRWAPLVIYKGTEATALSSKSIRLPISLKCR
jgi:hypothetical protein